MSDTETPVTDDLSFTGLHSSLAMSIQSELLIHDEEHQVLMLLEPGVSIENVRHFLETTLSVIPGLVDLLPDSLPVDGVTLSSLIFTPGSNGSPYHLEFVVGWGSAHWEIIPNLLALAAPSITVYVTGKADADDRTQVSATVAGTVEIKTSRSSLKWNFPTERSRRGCFRKTPWATRVWVGFLLTPRNQKMQETIQGQPGILLARCSNIFRLVARRSPGIRKVSTWVLCV